MAACYNRLQCGGGSYAPRAAEPHRENMVPNWNDFGHIWSTLRELDASSIREEAERSITITCVGHPAALEAIERLLHTGPQRYGPAITNPVGLVPLAAAGADPGALGSTDLLILGIDARVTLSEREVESFRHLEQLPLPFIVVIVYGDITAAAPLRRAAGPHVVTIADPAALDAPDRVATAVLDRLPGELHLAAARALPGLRAVLSRDLITTVSFTNATYSLASGLPEQIPILSVPFAAADIIILTKNQALLVYRLALAHGAPPDFQARMYEIAPVIGGAFVWRQVARSLVGLIPVWGLVPKIAVAYAGTYTIGVAAWRWYAYGELVSREQLKRISDEALQMGRARARQLLEQARASTKGSPGRLRRFLTGLRRRLRVPRLSFPLRRKKRQIQAPEPPAPID